MSKILLLCHYILKDDLADDHIYSKNHSNYELIGLLNGLYKQSWIVSETFRYPLTQDVFKQLLRENVIHTLDYYETDNPDWKKIYEERKNLEHSTYNQNIVGEIICPKLLRAVGTYDMIIMVNAPIDSVRLQSALYTNILSLLKPRGVFLADHRTKSEIGFLPFGRQQQKLISKSRQFEGNKTFILHPVWLPSKSKCCNLSCISCASLCKFNRLNNPNPIPLNKQFIYEKMEYIPSHT